MQTNKHIFFHVLQDTRLDARKEEIHIQEMRKQAQSNRFCCFQTVDAVFPKDPFSGYLDCTVWRS